MRVEFTRGTPELEKLYWSIHEAGHAVVGVLSGYTIDYATISGEEKADHWGVYHQSTGSMISDDASDEEFYESRRRTCRVNIAGAVAEYLAYRSGTLPPLPYWDEVCEDGPRVLLNALLMEMFKVQPVLEQLAKEFPEEFNELFGPLVLLPPAEEMLLTNWGAVEEVARVLREQDRVEGAELHALVQEGREAC